MPTIDNYTSQRVDLDIIEKSIINILQKDGRSSASSIAEEIGMSIPAVTKKIKRLRDIGVIIGFSATINPRRVGLDVAALITIISESSVHYTEVVKKAKKQPEIVECFTTTGNGSHILIAQTENTQTLEKLLRTIQGWPGVARTETQIILTSYKSSEFIKIP